MKITIEVGYDVKNKKEQTTTIELTSKQVKDLVEGMFDKLSYPGRRSLLSNLGIDYELNQ